ncbi:MAG: precorrin-4 C(11)-methyltransferase, partial [Bacteroides sp.]|nr:precorrin-4 C(11)-methyltransferase [Bacteroides sp.]
MTPSRIAIVLVSESSLPLARLIARDLSGDTHIYSKTSLEGCEPMESVQSLVQSRFTDFEAWVFIGALGICVRSIAPCITDKYQDPAVVNVDSTGRFVVSVLSGHVGGGNQLATRVAQSIGGQAVVTTQSDNQGLWALDTMARRYGWRTTASHEE